MEAESDMSLFEFELEVFGLDGVDLEFEFSEGLVQRTVLGCCVSFIAPSSANFLAGWSSERGKSQNLQLQLDGENQGREHKKKKRESTEKLFLLSR